MGNRNKNSYNNNSKRLKMDNTQLTQKAFHSALIITPPLELIQPIQDIRKLHDKAYDRSMLHVNLAFPFFYP
jgi:hypothetical protein